MADHTLTQQDWDIRLTVYQQWVKHGQVPTVQSIAEHMSLAPDTIRDAFHRLHAGHALFLRHDSDEILMAHPLSAIETDYQVTVDGTILYANCAWDSLGIPAMLNQDAQVSIQHPLTRETITYEIQNGELQIGEGGYVHFALPFSQWYDDLIDT